MSGRHASTVLPRQPVESDFPQLLKRYRQNQLALRAQKFGHHENEEKTPSRRRDKNHNNHHNNHHNNTKTLLLVMYMVPVSQRHMALVSQRQEVREGKIFT
eukprot:UN18899